MLDPQFEQAPKNADVTIKELRMMNMRQRPDLNLPKRAGAKIGWALDEKIKTSSSQTRFQMEYS